MIACSRYPCLTIWLLSNGGVWCLGSRRPKLRKMSLQTVSLGQLRHYSDQHPLAYARLAMARNVTQCRSPSTLELFATPLDHGSPASSHRPWCWSVDARLSAALSVSRCSSPRTLFDPSRTSICIFPASISLPCSKRVRARSPVYLKFCG